MEKAFTKSYQVKCEALISAYKEIAEVEHKEKMKDLKIVLEYMQENYVDHEKETDEKMEKLKKRCDCYEKMLPENICYNEYFYCHGIWLEGEGPKRCEKCEERWCNDCEDEHKEYQQDSEESKVSSSSEEEENNKKENKENVLIFLSKCNFILRATKKMSEMSVLEEKNERMKVLLNQVIFNVKNAKQNDLMSATIAIVIIKKWYA